jgi:hypothetical protein
MASTIKLKNGSGAPTTGDLVQGEPALDLTNKRLYTENASGVVIEVGVNPTSITTGNITANGTINLTGATVSNAGSITTADINGGTIDGTVIGGSSAAAITGTTITGTSFVSSGDMTFEDNDKAVFGDGSDLRIYHTGSHSTIENIGTGHLQIHTTDFRLRNSAGTESMILANADGNVQLFYDNAEKLATTATGIDVTGTVTADGLSLDNAQYINFKNSSNVSTRSLGINVANTFYIGGIDADIGDILFVDGGATRASFANGGDISFYEDTGTTAKLFWDASEERLGIGTTSPSVDLDVEGTAQVNLLEVTHDADRAVNFVKTGANTFSIEHDVNQFYFWNQTTSESPLLFQNDGDVIMNGGNVGIGTSSPAYKLDIRATSTPTIRVLETTNGPDGRFLASASDVQIGTYGGSPLSFYTNSTEKMRIDTSGNVGIGTASPSAPLNVYNASNPYAKFADAANYLNVGVVTSNYGAINSSLPISFQISDTERARIDSSGNLLVGTTTNLIWNTTNLTGCVIGGNSSSGGFSSIQVSRASDLCLLLNRLTSDGQIQAFARQGTQVGEITVTTSSTSYNTSSDYRLKENIADADDAGSKIDAIKVRQYDWKVDGSHQDYGMVAQELMTVAPEAVSGDPESDEMMGVDYSKLVPMMLKEIQSLRARVAQLEGAN